MKQLPWEDIQLFLALAQGGSLSAGARSLGLHVATVSRRLSALEERLGVRLVDRGAEGVSLTPAGEELLTGAARMEEEAQAVARAVVGQDPRLRGVLRFTTTLTLGDFILPHLQRFLIAHPEIVLELDIADETRDLARRQADVALRPSLTPPDDAIARPVGPMAWAIYRRWDLPPDAPWVGFLDNMPHIGPIKWWREHVADTSSQVRVGSVMGLRQAALAGLGRVILPCFDAAPFPALVRDGPPIQGLDSPVWVLHHVDLRRNARVRAMVSFLEEVLREEAPRMEGR